MSTFDFIAARRRMIHEQLLPRGISDRRVLAAMGAVPREKFVDAALQESAYDDCPLGIGFGQTISQPFTVAFMAQAAELRGDENVLEIGAGSGYAAAVYSLLARHVVSLERIAGLAEVAGRRLEELGYRNAEVHFTDGTAGWPSKAAYDAILVAAGAEELPLALPLQLAEGGRLIIPLGPRDYQEMARIVRHGTRLIREDLGRFAFVPLVKNQV